MNETVRGSVKSKTIGFNTIIVFLIIQIIKKYFPDFVSDFTPEQVMEYTAYLMAGVNVALRYVTNGSIKAKGIKLPDAESINMIVEKLEKVIMPRVFKYIDQVMKKYQASMESIEVLTEADMETPESQKGKKEIEVS